MQPDQDLTEPFQQFVSSHAPLVSVIVPSYKKAPFIAETIASIVAQDYKELEILIVNDGSPDNTIEVAKELIAKYSRVNIKLLDKPNGGVSDARNYGLSRAHGRVVMTIDGDDMLKPTYISTAVDTFRKTGANLFCANQENFGLENGEWIPHAFDRFYIRYDNCIPTPAVHDKALFVKSGGFKACLGYAEDWEYWVSLSRFDPVVVKSDEKLTRYRMNEDGIAATFINGRWKDCVSVVIITNQDLYSVEEAIEAHNHAPLSAETNLKRLRQLNEIHKNEWFLKFWIGLLEEHAGNIEASSALYSQAIELSDRNNWQPLYRMAGLLERVGQKQDAAVILHHVRILRPDMNKYIQPRLNELAK